MTTTTLGAITPGEARLVYNLNDQFTPHQVVIGAMTIGLFRTKDDARLFFQAHNTAQKTGKLPSQLLQERDEMKVLLFALHRYGSEQAAIGHAFPEEIMQPLYDILYPKP